MSNNNTAGARNSYRGSCDIAARAAADRLARMTALRAGPGGVSPDRAVRDRAAREIVAIVARTGYLHHLAAERLPNAEAVRREAGIVAADREWPAGLAAGVKELLAGDLPAFRAEVTACLAEELTRHAPALLDLDRIAGRDGSGGDGADPASACAWAAGLIRSRASGVWRTAVRQAVRGAKPAGGLLPPDLPDDGGSPYSMALLDHAATYRPLWRGHPAGDIPGGVTEADDARTDDVCDAMKRQRDGRQRLHLGAHQMTSLLRVPPVAPSPSRALLSLASTRAGQETVRQALRHLAGEDGTPASPPAARALHRAFGHWTTADLRAVTGHDEALTVIRVLVTAAASPAPAMTDAAARASAPALLKAVRARLSAPERAVFDEKTGNWDARQVAAFAQAVNCAFHSPRGERQAERAARHNPGALAREAGVSADVLEAAAYEVLVRQMLDTVPAQARRAPAAAARQPQAA